MLHGEKTAELNFRPSRIHGRRGLRVRRVQWAVAAGMLGCAGISQTQATLLFDNVTAFQTGAGTAGGTGTSSPFGTFEGDPYTLAAGGTNIAGFDVFPVNFSTQTFNALKINIFVWGTVNTNLSTVNASNPAFGNLLGSYSLTTVGGSFAPNTYRSYATGTPGTSPGITLGTPLSMAGLTTANRLGLSFNYQGSTDGGTTYNTVAGLTSIITYNASATTGSLLLSDFYYNRGNESNGNFITSPVAFGGINNQSIGTRVYDSVVAIGPDHNWTIPLDGDYTDPFAWSTGTVPTAADPAVFNLSSATAYTVNIPTAVAAGDVFVRNDKVVFDFPVDDTPTVDGSALSVSRSLSVGTPANGSTGSTVGSLRLTNSTNTAAFHNVDVASAVVGSNGGSGSLDVGRRIALFVNGPTSIGAGSVMTVQTGGFVYGNALTIAGTTNAWTGKLDVAGGVLDMTGSLANATNQAKTGFANGAFTGQGITSSLAAADTAHVTGVGVIQNNQSGGAPIYTSASPFDYGIIPDPADILIKYTYFGDANLDGKVNAADYTLVDAGFSLGRTGWLNGDFNYDGVVDGTDYTLMDNAFNHQTNTLVSLITPAATSAGLVQMPGSLDPALVGGLTFGGRFTGVAEAVGGTLSSAAVVAPVPEPATMAVLGLLAAGPLLARRRRVAQ